MRLEQMSQVVVRSRIARMASDRLAKALHRLIEALSALQRQPELVVCGRKIRIERQGLPETFFRFSVFTLILQNQPQPKKEQALALVLADRASDSRRLFQPPFRMGDQAEAVQRFGIIRRVQQNLPI